MILDLLDIAVLCACVVALMAMLPRVECECDEECRQGRNCRWKR